MKRTGVGRRMGDERSPAQRASVLRQQNLKVNCPAGAREGTLGCGSGRIQFAQTEEKGEPHGMGHGVGRAHAELYRRQAEALELENAGKNESDTGKGAAECGSTNRRM